jgi:hypothetical protein
MELYQDKDTGEDRILIKGSSILNQLYDIIPEYHTHVDGNVVLAKSAMMRLGERGEDSDFYQLCGDVGMLMPRLITSEGQICWISPARRIDNQNVDLSEVGGLGLFYSQKMGSIIVDAGYVAGGNVPVVNGSFSLPEFLGCLDALVEVRIATLGY